MNTWKWRIWPIRICLLSAWMLVAGCTSTKETDGAKAGHGKKEVHSNAESDTRTPNRHEPNTPSGNKEKVSSVLRFRDHFANSGIRHQYDDGRADEMYSIVESLGGGVAAFDFERDGETDLFFTSGGRFDRANRKLTGLGCSLNRGQGQLQWKDVSREAWIDHSEFYNHAPIGADFDSDGYDDLLITGYGGLQLFRNLGDGTFARVDQAANLIDELWSSTAAWGDVDGDGDLDVYVAHYADWSFANDPICASNGVRDVCGPRDFQGVDHKFFRNEGDGTFKEVSKEIGLIAGGRGLGAIAADLDGDGKVEFFVGNDEEANFLYRNDGGKLVEIGVRSGTALDDSGSPDGNMGIGLGDFDRDGRFDLFVTHYETETCALYVNKGRLSFKHDSRRANITSMGNLFVGWGIAFMDFDLDLDEDIFIVNGHAVRHAAMAPIDQVPVLMENIDGITYRNTAEDAGDFFSTPRSARGLATADFDHDGRMDVATSSVLQPHGVVRNEAKIDLPEGGKRHWLKVRLVGAQSNRNAIGATLSCSVKGIKIARQVFGGGSYNSTADRVIHLGLGDQREVENITIAWPSGQKTTLEKVQADQTIMVVEGEANPFVMVGD